MHAESSFNRARRVVTAALVLPLLVGATVTDRAGAITLSEAPATTRVTADIGSSATTRYPKLTAPGGQVVTRLNPNDQVVSWMANPTTISVFLPPDSGRIIAAPAGTQFRDSAVVGGNIFAVDTLNRLLMSQLDRGTFRVVADVSGAGGIYATPNEVWVSIRSAGPVTMRRFDAVTGKLLGELPKIYSVLATSSNRIATIAEGPNTKTLELVVFDAKTMGEVHRSRHTKVINSGAMVSDNLVLLAFPDGVQRLDLVSGKMSLLGAVKTQDIIGNGRGVALMALASGRLGCYLAGSGTVIELGSAPTGAAGISSSTFWAWDRDGLVRIDLAKLVAELAKRQLR